jgi:hypothetical protein
MERRTLLKHLATAAGVAASNRLGWSTDLEPGFKAPADIQIVPGLPFTKDSAPRWYSVILVRSHSKSGLIPDVQVENASILGIHPLSSSALPNVWNAFLVEIEGKSPGSSAALHVTLGGTFGARASSRLPIGLDLRRLDWEVLLNVSGPGMPDNSAGWNQIQLPALSSGDGVTWLRASFHEPPAWSGLKLHLHLRAVGSWGEFREPAVRVFLNGEAIEVSKCAGVRDQRHTYEFHSSSLRADGANSLMISLGHSGITLADAPFAIVAGGEPVTLWPFAEPVIQEEVARAPSQPSGKPLPLRPMEVREGVLRYRDGGEVALWGVNCYPQSYTEYDALKKRGVDPREAVRQNLDDFVRLGINIVRVHVFDREISDAAGNLIANDHLNVLDYLIAECSRQGVYLMVTPIAWWWSPNALADSFSNSVPKQALPMWPKMWPAEANYIRQLLAHVNPYTGRKLVDEPCLALFEIVNEPEYWTYRDITLANPRIQYELTAEKQRRGVQGVVSAWHKFAPNEEWRTPEVFAVFRYDTLLRYVNTMTAAIRDAGARQPVAYSSFFIHEPEIAQAVADSRCEAVTLGAYPGGMERLLDKVNLLGKVWNDGDAPDLLGPLDARFAKKARLVYEFDAACMMRQVIMYPYLAQLFRRIGVQVACQFQYDTKALAAFNETWPQHYLNAWHTPAKMVSFLIGGEVFRRSPRGAFFEIKDGEMAAAPLAYSFSKNVALLCAPDCYMQTGPSDWHPLAAPRSPARIMSIGACEYFQYPGNGIVDVKITGEIATVQVYPDVERPARSLTGDFRVDMTGTADKPLTILHQHEQLSELRMPGWKDEAIERLPSGILIVRKSRDRRDRG